MSDSDDPFLVTSPLGITSVLRALVAQKTLIHMRLERNSQTIITTLLHIDSDQGRMIVDAAADDVFNQRLTKTEKVYFDAQIDRIRVEFHTGQATPCTFENREAFWIPLPDALRRVQRRDHYRIDIPVSAPLFCEVRNNGDLVATLPVKDISAGGLALLDRNEEVKETEGSQLRQCVLELDDIGTVIVNLKIRRISNQLLGDAKPVRVIACEFDRPSPPNVIMIQNYIGRLERMLNARRRGFD